MTEERKEELRCRIEAIRSRMETAARKAGREPSEILLLAATKTVPAEEINFAAKCGITEIGENRVQELLEKYESYDKEHLHLHFIGRLQKNKVKYIIDKVCLIHSLDSIPLAAEIDRQAEKHGLVMDVLVEVNSGREENKGGVLPEELEEFFRQLTTFSHIRVKGLMAVAPICADEKENMKYFSESYQKFLDIFGKKPHNREGCFLSMGMSDSFEEAIGCGSSLVRIGSAIFGARNYPEQRKTDEIAVN